jgi:two-component system, chemotaxis family, chemotaxis protein CheY
MDPVPPKKVLLVGHCRPDASYLRIAVKKALGQADIILADEPAEFESALAGGVDLILFNRELGYGFAPDAGVEAIRVLKQKYPAIAMMLITNYPETQAAAIAAGAVPGFGKRDISSPRSTELLRSAAGLTQKS